MVGVIWYLMALFGAMIGVVVALFLHEFAHAVPLLITGGSAHIIVGSDAGRTARLGPLTVTFGVDSVMKLMQYGHYEPNGSHSTRVHALSVLAGPFTTVLLVSLLGAVIYRGVSEPLLVGLTFIFFSELYRALQTVVPNTYSDGPYAGMKSDAKRFLQIVSF